MMKYPNERCAKIGPALNSKVAARLFRKAAIKQRRLNHSAWRRFRHLGSGK